MALIIRVWRINGGERREKGRDDLCLKRLKDLQLFAAEEVSLNVQVANEEPLSGVKGNHAEGDTRLRATVDRVLVLSRRLSSTRGL